MDFLIDGQISSFCPDQHGAEAFNPNNAIKSHSIFVKLQENTFWDCCNSPKSVISGNLSKNVWASQWPTSSELKIKLDLSLERSWCEYFELCYGLSLYHLPPSSPGVLLEPLYLVVSKMKFWGVFRPFIQKSWSYVILLSCPTYVTHIFAA